MSGIGIDIGTTTICGAAISRSGELKKAVTLPNDSALPGKEAWEKLQDPARIEELCARVITLLSGSEEETETIGFSGQMHGILYLDREGRAVSPLYSWQDGRGNLPVEKKSQDTYCQELSALCGYSVASGYGLATHYYNLKNGLVPESAVSMCTIADYIAMKTAGRKTPLLHRSMAAGLGIFDPEKGKFDEEALARAGIDRGILPEVSESETYLGECAGNIRVAAALGDNQAAFYGSVKEDSTVLINVGTGSQVSVYAEPGCEQLFCLPDKAGLEIRPYIKDSFLIVGAPLCGGAAYALLKDFFVQTVQAFTGETPENPYSVMNELAERAYLSHGQPLPVVDTRFRGTRKDPAVRGSVKNIGWEDFTPEALTAGVLQGMVRELYEIYAAVPETYRRTEVITCSGNGIRRNPLLRKMAEDVFGMPVRLAEYKEEAACGAALYAMRIPTGTALA